MRKIVYIYVMVICLLGSFLFGCTFVYVILEDLTFKRNMQEEIVRQVESKYDGLYIVFKNETKYKIFDKFSEFKNIKIENSIKANDTIKIFVKNDKIINLINNDDIVISRRDFVIANWENYFSLLILSLCMGFLFHKLRLVYKLL